MMPSYNDLETLENGENKIPFTSTEENMNNLLLENDSNKTSSQSEFPIAVAVSSFVLIIIFLVTLTVLFIVNVL